MNRRTFLKSTITTCGLAAPVLIAGYGFAESSSVVIDRRTVGIPRLPSAFAGTTVAFLTDIHLGPYLSADFVTSVVRTTLALNPDLIVLGGDYSLRDVKYVAPCFDVLRSLSAPLGVYGVLGNHDYWHGVEVTRSAMRAARITELTNRGVWLNRGSARLRLAGVDDLWEGRPDVYAAVGEATPSDACILVSHNPDFAETMTDRRVGLVLSGHTHGGQVVIPDVGAPWIPSRYGMKYSHGLVDAPATQVYVSTGLGMSSLPIRMNCPPQLALLTLVG